MRNQGFALHVHIISVFAAAERGASSRKEVPHPCKVQVLSVCLVWYRKSPTVTNGKEEEA
jgi:hypothetical protein